MELYAYIASCVNISNLEGLFAKFPKQIIYSFFFFFFLVSPFFLGCVAGQTKERKRESEREKERKREGGRDRTVSSETSGNRRNGREAWRRPHVALLFGIPLTQSPSRKL